MINFWKLHRKPNYPKAMASVGLPVMLSLFSNHGGKPSNAFCSHLQWLLTGFFVSIMLLDGMGKVLEASLGRSWVQVFQEFSAEFGLRYLPTRYVAYRTTCHSHAQMPYGRIMALTESHLHFTGSLHKWLSMPSVFFQRLHTWIPPTSYCDA